MASQQPSAVRFYAPDHPALAVTVRARLEQRRKEAMAELVDSYATSWDDYNRKAGVIRGMSDALQIVDVVEREIAEHGR